MVKKILFISLVPFVLLLFELAGEPSEDAAAQLEQADAYVEDENYEQAEMMTVIAVIQTIYVVKGFVVTQMIVSHALEAVV